MTDDVKALLQLCQTLISNGDLDEDGVRQLSEHINESPEVTESWPGNALLEPLQKAWADGVVDVQELSKATTLVASIVMWHAYKTGDDHILKQAIDRGADLNSKDKESTRTLLHFACDSDDKETVVLLIFCGADINVKRVKYGQSPLHDAVSLDRRGIIKLLLDNGANVNAKDDFDDTPLDCAGNEELDDLLRAYGAASGKLSKQDNSLIHSIWIGDEKSVEEQLANGAHVNVKAGNFTGLTPLDFAFRRSQEQIAILLRNNGGKTKEELEVDKSFIEAVWNQNAEGIKYKFTKGADVNAKEDKDDEWAPLHIAVRRGYIEIAKLLVSLGANVNVNTIDGWNPLHIAAIYGNNNVVELLISEGADKNAIIDSGRYQGMTPLDSAIWRKQNITAELLKKLGAKRASGLS